MFMDDLLTNHKLNIIAVGSCLIEDILRADSLRAKKYIIKSYYGSITRGAEPPGKVAQRLLNEVPKPTKENFFARQYKFVTKDPSPYSIIKNNINSKSIIIVDFSYEMNDFFFDGNEIFDLIPHKNPAVGYPEWFQQLVHKNTFNFDNETSELVMHQYKGLLKFRRFLETLDAPVIVMDNFFTKKVYDKQSNTVGSIIPLYNRAMLPFKNVKGISNDLELFYYNESIIENFYTKIRENIAPFGVTFFKPKDRGQLFADLDHPWGFHPIHLHRLCRERQARDLYALIQSVYKDYHNKKKPTITL